MAKAEIVVENPEDAPVQPIQSRSRLLIILAFSALILLEMLLLLWFLPKSSVPAPPEGGQVPPPSTFEVEVPPRLPLGERSSNPIEPFSVMVHSVDGTTGNMVNAQFSLMCEKSKQARYTNLYEKIKDEIRQEIQIILRSSTIQEITDPNNTVIRNKILRKVNEIFNEPQPLVKEVLVLSFQSSPL